MKITDTTDFCWRVFFSPYITVSAHFPWCFRLCAFLLSSSSKNSTFFRCFAIIICVSLDVFLFRRIIDYICRCVYVLCAWENKRISSIQAECERVELRESWRWMWEAVFWHKLRNVYQAKPFKCQALNFEVHFAPFPIRSSCRKKFVFFSSFRPNSTYEFSFFHT